MKLRYTRRALNDIERERAYLLARSPKGAQNVMDQLNRAIDYIARSNRGSVETDIKNVRAKWVNRYHYKIFYEVGGGEIILVHVRHTSRRPWSA